MAKLRVFSSIEDNLYILDFINDTDALSDTDKQLMDKFGEPEIDMGGTYLTSPDQFTLPSNLVKIRSGFPFRQTFDSTSSTFNTDTVTKVNGYKSAIITKFTNAMTTLRANTDTFTGESVTVV